MKPPFRTKSVGTKVSEEEFALLEERALSAGLTLSEWVRGELLAEPEEPEAGADEAAAEVILAEMLALRTLFLKNNTESSVGSEIVFDQWGKTASLWGVNVYNGNGAGQRRDRRNGILGINTYRRVLAQLHQPL